MMHKQEIKTLWIALQAIMQNNNPHLAFHMFVFFLDHAFMRGLKNSPLPVTLEKPVRLNKKDCTQLTKQMQKNWQTILTLQQRDRPKMAYHTFEQYMMQQYINAFDAVLKQIRKTGRAIISNDIATNLIQTEIPK